MTTAAKIKTWAVLGGSSSIGRAFAATAATAGSLASRVKECSERGFFEDQLCRWRVCEGHWGKDRRVDIRNLVFDVVS